MRHSTSPSARPRSWPSRRPLVHRRAAAPSLRSRGSPSRMQGGTSSPRVRGPTTRSSFLLARALELWLVTTPRSKRMQAWRSSSHCKITLGTAGSFTLSATDTSRGTVTAGTSAPFTVAGGATKLAFSVQPTSTTGGAVFSTAPVVWVEDAGGNLVTTANNQVTLTIKSGTGTLSGCTAAVTATGGIATFNNCKINSGHPGVIYAPGCGHRL